MSVGCPSGGRWLAPGPGLVRRGAGVGGTAGRANSSRFFALGEGCGMEDLHNAFRVMEDTFNAADLDGVGSLSIEHWSTYLMHHGFREVSIGHTHHQSPTPFITCSFPRILSTSLCTIHTLSFFNTPIILSPTYTKPTYISPPPFHSLTPLCLPLLQTFHLSGSNTPVQNVQKNSIEFK